MSLQLLSRIIHVDNFLYSFLLWNWLNVLLIRSKSEMCSQYILHLLDFDFAHCDDGCIFTFKGMLLKIALFSFITTNHFHIQLEYHICQQLLFQKKDWTYWWRIFFGTIKVRLIEVCCHPVSWLRTLSSSAGLPLEGLTINTVLWYFLSILKLNDEP